MRHAKLRLSHIQPRFVGKWLKNTSPSPRFRTTIAPNVPVQDLKKLHLLCESCEQHIGRWERHFAEAAFHPTMGDGSLDPFQMIGGRRDLQIRAPDLLFFSLSLAWRSAIAERFTGTFSIDDAAHYDAMIEAWRMALLTESEPDFSSHHVTQGPEICRALNELGATGIRFRYVLRIVECRGIVGNTTLTSKVGNEIVDARKLVGIYTKLPGFAFMSLFGFPTRTIADPVTLDHFFKATLTESLKQLTDIATQLSAEQLTTMAETGHADVGTGRPSLAVRCDIADMIELHAFRSTGVKPASR